MIGNVSEWVADWYEEDYYKKSPKENPKGAEKSEEKVMRGGSWMCADSYCRGYRPGARMKTATDTGLSNTGFRCAKDAK